MSAGRGRPAAPVLSTVFSRDNMRFIRNRAGCLNLASYHGVYPRFGDDRLTEALLCYLNSELCAAVQKRARREYGSGLHKFEPGDLLELPAMPVGEISRKDALKMASLFRKLAASGGAREKLDETVNEMALSLAPDPGRRSRRPGGAV